jgi:tetratricopeptide (TPR) repeat protein
VAEASGVRPSWSRPLASSATSAAGVVKLRCSTRGTLHRVSADLAQAKRCHRRALELARAIASSWDEAHALAGLGRCDLAAGHAAQAEALLRQALEIFRRIGAAEAPRRAR